MSLNYFYYFSIANLYNLGKELRVNILCCNIITIANYVTNILIAKVPLLNSKTSMNKKNKYRTDFLFATPNFLMGAGSIFNIAGNYYEFNSSSTGELADSKALECDWLMVGQDMNEALDKYQEELEQYSY